ncbi:MAG: 5'-deoxynucleotidase [Lachnospiraceae bacterium]|nr:5'-deoxynucleotidase [Lachnospiraceae bacterium]
MNNFYAMLSRMKYINRWALMRNTYTENISEHSLEVAMLAHALAVIGNIRLGKQLDADRAAVIALFHDATEIITGDMPTPIKYLNKDIKGVYKEIEAQAANRLLDMLPEDLRDEYQEIFFPEKTGNDEYLCKLVKAADKLSALIKCIEEGKTENHEFDSAGSTINEAIEAMELPELDIFMKEFLPAYELTLDELNRE